MSPARRRHWVCHVCRQLGVSERKACRVLGQSRSTQRYVCQQPEIDKPLVQKLLSLHVKHPHYGYRRITIRLREKGWFVNFKRVYRLWCQEGLKIRKKQHKRRFEGSSKNACHRKRPAYKNHIWSYDFLSERLENGRLVKLLVVIDEYTRECLALDVNQSLRSQDVIEVLRYLFAVRGEPAYIRSDNGPEFTSTAVKTWLSHTNARTLFVAKSSPWETGYVESFNSKLRDELLNRELFLHLDELMYIVDCWRMDYNHYRPHSSLDYMAPAAFAATLAKNHSEPQSGKLPPCGPNLPDCRKDFLCQQNDRILS